MDRFYVRAQNIVSFASGGCATAGIIALKDGLGFWPVCFIASLMLLGIAAVIGYAGRK